MDCYFLKARPTKCPKALPAAIPAFEGGRVGSSDNATWSGRFSLKNFFAIGDAAGISEELLQLGHASCRDDSRQIE